jgi:hypothetical protein
MDSSQHDAGRSRAGSHPSPAELAAQQGVAPLRSADDLIERGAFATYEELDAFLADLYAERRAGRQQVREQLRAQLGEHADHDGSPWREQWVELVDPNTQELVCRLAYPDAVVLAFEIEQMCARVLAGQWLREIMQRDDPTGSGCEPRPGRAKVPAADPDQEQT